MKMKSIGLSAAIAIAVIEELNGSTKTAELFSITPQAVSQWKRNGIPKPWLMFLRKEFPDLKAWHLADADNHQTMKE